MCLMGILEFLVNNSGVFMSEKKSLNLKIVKDEKKVPVVKQSKRSYTCGTRV
jgi:hypothetical protein